jgi:hypothetical protein
VRPKGPASASFNDKILREDIDKVDEPQLKAMFETSAEVLLGLSKAFSNCERNEPAVSLHGG